MYGIWWTSYDVTVNTWLYDKPATEKDGVLTTITHMKDANTWSAKDNSLSSSAPGTDEQAIKDYTRTYTTDFAYTFQFSKIHSSNLYNYAKIKLSKKIYGYLASFNMKAETVCSQCREYDQTYNPDAGNKTKHGPHEDFSKLSPAATKAQTCNNYTTSGGSVEPGRDQCWRRYTNFFYPRVGPDTKKASLVYDVIKIVDQYGDVIQPNFNNWKSALAKGGIPHVNLAEGEC